MIFGKQDHFVGLHELNEMGETNFEYLLLKVFEQLMKNCNFLCKNFLEWGGTGSFYVYTAGIYVQCTCDFSFLSLNTNN